MKTECLRTGCMCIGYNCNLMNSHDIDFNLYFIIY